MNAIAISLSRNDFAHYRSKRNFSGQGLHFISRLLVAIELVDKAAASQLIDETQVDKILRLGFSRFGIP